jgi:hypothetical protein
LPIYNPVISTERVLLDPDAPPMRMFRIPVAHDVIHVRDRDACLAETRVDRERREHGRVFLAVDALFFRRRVQLSLAEPCGSRVVVDAGNPEYEHE